MKIALFFTEGMSLKGWHQAGLVQRDSLLYEKLIEAGHEVIYVTYGGSDDPSYLPPESKIKVLHRPDSMGMREYSWGMHAIHRAELQTVDLIKSHQVQGARYAAYAKLRLRKPYMARCGYLPSYFMRQAGANRRQQWRTALEEFISFQQADVVCVPSAAEKRYLQQRYGIRGRKIHLCPNWIDTEHFQPNPAIEKNPRLVCYIGRFEAQKNPLSLLEALRALPDVELLMIGGGSLKSAITSKIEAYGITATVLDRVPNEDLPDHLNRAAVYVLPTRYEGGSPKTLFEAMACELPIISTDGFGVDEAFTDGQHGIKVAVDDTPALYRAIHTLLDDTALRQQLGKQGRQHVIQHYSVQQAIARERAILEGVISDGRKI